MEKGTSTSMEVYAGGSDLPVLVPPQLSSPIPLTDLPVCYCVYARPLSPAFDADVIELVCRAYAPLC